MTKRTKNTPIQSPARAMAIAACSMAIAVGTELQLTPAGNFKALDGRPVEVAFWHIDAAIAAKLIAAADQRTTPYVIDYEHQTLRAKDNGQPAPAAGFFKKLEWREGVGLFAVDVEWTPRAQGLIEAGEYKYISPVFAYDELTGDVTMLLMAAVTNNPAIDGMDAVLVAAASTMFSTPTDPQPEKDTSMDELLEQLRWLLNMPVGATAEDVTAQLQKLIDSIKQDATVTAAASFDVRTYLADQRTAIAALSAATPDPAKYVPIATMQAMQQQLAVLSAGTTKARVDELVNGALAAGKLLPIQEQWARDYGAKDVAALSAFIETAPVLAILNGTQTNGVPPNNAKVVALTANQEALCKAMGITEADFLKTLQGEQDA